MSVVADGVVKVKDMTQEDRQHLLLKDLCGRLPYKPIIRFRDRFDVELTPDRVMLYVAEEAQPYLRPMSSMTEEECVEISKIDALIENIGEIIQNLPYYMEIASVKQVDWLNAHHFDYRGLISMGLAIEVTEENNPYKN